MVKLYKPEYLEAVKEIALENAKEILLNIEDIIAHNDGRVFVFELNGEIVAFGFFQPFAMGKRIDVGIVVKKEVRRQGIGKALWHSISRLAKEKFVAESFECRIVADDLAAINFCGKIGFLPWIATHTMIYNDELLPTPATLFEPYEDKYYEDYYELLGQAFYDMRKSIGAEPFKIVPNGNREEMFEYETFLAINSQDKPIAAVTIEMGNHIENLCVLPEAQDLGFGRQLAIFATNRALMSERGFAELEVVSTNEKAIGLYKSLGYKTVRTIAVLKMKA
ncbi:MAG: GNAT family N-acetyltransferase [Clostridia bacterium]|nr:GNAT family N-acetyltransferase [Clostridia bacterium]MBR5266258.1 GNAT family N-acetyltransferase [Clostridia bacterium]